MDLIITDNRLTTEHFTPKTPGSAGIDLRACGFKVGDNIIPLDSGQKIIAPGERVLFDVGFRLHIKDKGVAGLLLPRSGIGHKHGIVLGNLVGLMDSDYQGSYFASVWNSSYEPFRVKPLDRICQLAFVPVIHPEFSVVESFEETERGEGGFGHTGEN